MRTLHTGPSKQPSVARHYLHDSTLHLDPRSASNRPSRRDGTKQGDDVGTLNNHHQKLHAV
jgi:hypothetical protein